MTRLVKTNATYDDLVDLPENVNGEIVGGDLYATPRPRVRHAQTHAVVLADVLTRFGRDGAAGPGGWLILIEPELHFGPEVLVPDVAGWHRERVRELSGDTVKVTIPPDWVAEIVSPSTARLDRVLKLPIYARAGVGHAWIVDPAVRTLEVLRLEGGGWAIASQHAEADRVRAEPFDAVEIDLAQWWY